MSDEMDEIWALFVDDGAQAMDAMETALLALEKATGEQQPPHISALFRAARTRVVSGKEDRKLDPIETKTLIAPLSSAAMIASIWFGT